MLALAKDADGLNWDQDRTETGLKVESLLEEAGLKRRGERRDQGAGGARTYRAWLKSLGLVFMKDGVLHLTSAGQAIVEGAPPAPILTKQVLTYQFPSAFTHKGASEVDPSFKVRPFILVLQLLRDPRLSGFLTERDDIAKIVLCYGTSNHQDTIDSVAERIIELRNFGIESLEDKYLEKFKSTRSNETHLDQLFENLSNIANTAGNWLGYTQLITRDNGTWRLTMNIDDEVDELIRNSLSTQLIKDSDNEEKFQRRYGLKPGQSKDTRNLTAARSITSSSIAERSVEITFQALSTTRIVETISLEIVKEISDGTGVPADKVEQILSKKYPNGAVDGFMNSYAQMAFNSRENATEFEIATAEIFGEVFGLDARHIGAQGLRPDVVLSSREVGYGAIIDSKAYKNGYSLGVSQQNRMRDYIRDFRDYALDDNPLGFFSYVVSDYKSSIESQLEKISRETGVSGSAITARDIIRMVRRHQSQPYTHQEIRKLLSGNRAINVADFSSISDEVFNTK